MLMESTVEPTRAAISGPKSSCANWNNTQNSGTLAFKTQTMLLFLTLHKKDYDPL